MTIELDPAVALPPPGVAGPLHEEPADPAQQLLQAFKEHCLSPIMQAPGL